MKKIYLLLVYTIIFFNSNLLSNERNNILKVGLLAPLSGEYKELGDSLLYSLQLALEEIDDKNIFIIPGTLDLVIKKNLILLFKILNLRGLIS